MWPSRHLLSSVAVQALGAAATFGVGIAIAAVQGPTAQGRYGLLRTAADLLLALALFGLPQSMVHALNQRGASAQGLLRMGLRYAAVLGAVVVGAVLAFGAAGPGLPQWLGSPLALLALLAGTLGWVVQGLLRAFALCRGTAVQFAWLSVMPALTLLVAVAGLLVGGSQRYEWAIAASGVASAVLAFASLRPLRAQPGWAHGGTAPLAGLLGDGTHAFAQAATLALQPWVTLLLLRQQGASVAEVGLFVFAAHVAQAFALPTTFVAPLLFAKISRAAGEGRHYAASGVMLRVLGLALLGSLVLALLLPWGVPALFGNAYTPAVAACVWLALAGPVLVGNRLGVSVLFGRGRFRATSALALLRALALPLCLWGVWASGRFDAVTGAALGWLLVEALCAMALVVGWKGLPMARAAKGSA